MAENKLADISTEFAIQILKLTDSIEQVRKKWTIEKTDLLW